MEIIKGFSIIMIFLFLGEFISKGLNIPIPGNVIGMILLFLALVTRIVKLSDVENVGTGLIKNLSLFFVPVGVGIILYFDAISKNAVPILSSIVLSTFIVLIITGHITQLIMGIKKEVDKDD
ncbi:MAG: CidA/LrgA family protein [Thermovenabulum sp.]|uniref:CidA/LrgA family protein n=1 Tax=Thermovenabulum sp. TaxID=3100335 RepID=UPI003C7AA362